MVIIIKEKYSVFNLFILILISLFYICNTAVILPFTTEQINYNNLNTTELIDKFYIRDVYTQLNIGTPLQSISIRFSINTDEFYISKPDTEFEKKYPKKNTTNFYFNKNLSSTFNYNETGHNYNSHPHFSKSALDNFEFSSFEKNILIKNFNFYLAEKINGPYHGLIGFGPLHGIDEKNQFLVSLEKYNITKNYIWHLNYSNYENGKIIIGEYPHEYNNNFYKINNLIKTNGYENGHWNLFFDRILVNSFNNNTYVNMLKFEIDHYPEIRRKYQQAFLNYNRGLIIGSYNYENFIKETLFNKFINKNLCFVDIYRKVIYYDDEKYRFIYCDLSIYDEIKKEFNPIIFEHLTFKKNFTLNFEDVFEIKNKILFFKIIFDRYNDQQWYLNAPFLHKYLFLFDSNSSEIGYYTENNEEKNNFGFSVTKIVIFVIIGVLLLLSGIFIGKLLYDKKRKKRVNELDDLCDYNENKENQNEGLYS